MVSYAVTHPEAGSTQANVARKCVPPDRNQFLFCIIDRSNLNLDWLNLLRVQETGVAVLGDSPVVSTVISRERIPGTEQWEIYTLQEKRRRSPFYLFYEMFCIAFFLTCYCYE
jgi:hypothetical protein